MNIQISSLSPGLLLGTPAASISVAPAPVRLSLRARGDLAPIHAALGLNLPDRIGWRAAAGGIEALRLGPDEWTLLCTLERAGAITAALAKVYPALPHSLVDISGREVTFLIDGPRAAELLTIACPRDIASIPPGEGRRTVFDGASVVIWCDASDRYRMDVWNSFAGFIARSLLTGGRELAAEIA